MLLSLEAFDRLEGVEDDTFDSDFTEHLTGDTVDISKSKIKVINALHGKKDVWAGRMIQNILVNGLRLNFGGKLPFLYQEANNKSFINNKEFGVSQVLKLLENQVIEEVSPTDLQCVNPLSIASNRKGKQRLCLDLSRCVNEAVVAKKFRIESISDFMKAVKQGSWAFYYDLRSAFHHVRVNIKHRKYLGLCIKVEGQDRYYRFVGMPFGYRDASRILTKLMRTPLTKWRAEGTPSYLHIDDGLGFKPTLEEAKVAAKQVREDLQELGLVVSEEKCAWEPCQEFQWCGFDWDLKEFKVMVPQDKKTRIKEMARELMDSKTVMVKQVAAFTGLVISCTPAVGRSARFYTRTTVAWCQSLVDETGWGSQGELPRWVKNEISFWVERIDEFSGQMIRQAALILEFYVCSDSGKYQIGGRVAKKGSERRKQRFQVTLEDWETEASSTYRELRSIECGLILIAPEARGSVVRYGNDNYAANRCVEYGSTKDDCHEVARRIHDLVEKYNIQLEMVWRRRNTEEIVLCDKISKTFDLSEFRIQMDSFNKLQEEFGPWTMDWFASDWSRRLERFASRFWTVGCEHTDAFSQDWGEEEGFFHPPLEVLASVLEKVEKYGARGVIVVPDWPGSEVDSLMQQASKVVELMAVRSMEFESPLWRKDNTFRGWPNFGMRVYRIR